MCFNIIFNLIKNIDCVLTEKFDLKFMGISNKNMFYLNNQQDLKNGSNSKIEFENI